MWLGTFYQPDILTLLPLHLGYDCGLSLSSFKNSAVLIALPILPAWLLTNQHFIKPIQVTNLYSVHEHYPTALPLFSFQNKNSESNLLCLAF